MQEAMLTVNEDCESMTGDDNPASVATASPLSTSESDYEIVAMMSSTSTTSSTSQIESVTSATLGTMDTCNSLARQSIRSLSIDDIHDNFIIRLPMTPKLRGFQLYS